MTFPPPLDVLSVLESMSYNREQLRPEQVICTRGGREGNLDARRETNRVAGDEQKRKGDFLVQDMENRLGSSTEEGDLVQSSGSSAQRAATPPLLGSKESQHDSQRIRRFHGLRLQQPRCAFKSRAELVPLFDFGSPNFAIYKSSSLIEKHVSNDGAYDHRVCDPGEIADASITRADPSENVDRVCCEERKNRQPQRSRREELMKGEVEDCQGLLQQVDRVQGEEKSSPPLRRLTHRSDDEEAREREEKHEEG
ncbi:6754_t:CDS:2, partial [Acaulospora colombiana]